MLTDGLLLCLTPILQQQHNGDFVRHTELQLQKPSSKEAIKADYSGELFQCSYEVSLPCLGRRM